MTIETDDGTIQAQLGGDWPDNEFTKLLPKPDFALNVAADSGDAFTVAFVDATVDQLKEYVEKVKSAGFTVDAETEESEVMGMSIYNYTAQNAAGYSIMVFSVAGSVGMTIEKP
jgi:hypothetical protein